MGKEVNKIELNKKTKELIKKKKTIDKLIKFNEENLGFKDCKLLIKKIPSELRGVPYVYYNKLSENIKYSIKFIPILGGDEYDTPECKLLREFSKLNLINIPFYFGNYKLNINSNKIKKQHNFEKYHRKEEIREKCILLVTEYLHGGDLENFADQILDVKEEKDQINIWYSILFQIVFTLAILQDKYKFNHNDLHFNNILIDDTIEPGGYLQYKLKTKDGEKTFNIYNYGFIVKIWDMEFSSINNNTNELSKMNSELYGNMPVVYDKYYDLHYIINNLIDLPLPDEIYKKITGLYKDEDLFDLSEITESSDSDSNSFSDSDSDSDSFSEIQPKITDKPVIKGRLKNDYDRSELISPLELLSSNFFDIFVKKIKERKIVYKYSFIIE
jgi:hypothetical protein